ncbi:MAG: hypothetical protein KDJ33_18010 [Gammaproteobacteria bacterium]|nr:hypothetical protein [Gammaproteobacteria bacterium]
MGGDVAMIVECFARRIMAPFQGVLQMIRVGAGEAESVDGRHWVLYAAHPDILAHSGLSEVRFGTWSTATGLRRAVVRGTAAGSLIERIGQPLIGALEAFAGQAPFPLHDRMEYWLVDGLSGRPLILLDSLLADEPVPPAEPPNWLPGKAARDEFAGLAELEQMLIRRAGPRPRGLWFGRDDQGGGRDPEQRYHPPQYFPRLLLTTDWPEPRQRTLARAFIDWWSPALLQLQHLSDSERGSLERAAAQRAGVLARLFRLYPKTIDEDLIRVARVQARMQASRSSVAHYEEPFLWLE